MPLDVYLAVSVYNIYLFSNCALSHENAYSVNEFTKNKANWNRDSIDITLNKKLRFADRARSGEYYYFVVVNRTS